MSDVVFKDGDIVWVKCGTLFWPAKVLDFDNLPEEIKEDFPEGNPKPQTIAKFFDEDGYEYLFDNKNIFPYNCSRKEEFIKKGIAKSKSKSKEGATSGWFAKFPKDVVLSEKLTGGDENILEKEPYADKPTAKINYKDIFGQSAAQTEKEKEKEKPKAENAKKRKAETTPAKKVAAPGGKKKKESEKPARPIVHPRFKEGGSDHQVKILPQPSAPYHIDLQIKQEKMTSASPNTYTCPICGFMATRINVIVLHSKSHSEPAKNNAGNASAVRKPPVPAAKETKKAAPASPKTAPTAKKSAVAATPKSASKAKQTTPAAKAASAPTAAAGATETPKRGRGRPPASAAATAPAASASPAGQKSPSKTASDAAKVKKPRMTKKKKEQMLQEKEKKQEERQKIMGEWSEEEEEEAEEKKKINENLGKSSEYSDDSDVEAYLGDDHVHGYDDDDDEEMEPLETEQAKNEEVEEKALPKVDERETNGQTEKEGTEEATNQEEETKTDKEEVEKEKEKQDELPTFDIDKVLAETSVPEMSAEIENVMIKKSVKFSPNISKEIAFKTITVMQPESNLLDPQDVDDEFAFTEEPKIPELMSTKTILKRSRTKDSPFKSDSPNPTATVKLTFNAPAEELTDEDKEEDNVNSSEASAATGEVVTASSEAESVQSQIIARQPEQPEKPCLAEQGQEHAAAQHLQIPTQMVLQTSEGQHLQVHNGDSGDHEHDGETYILLVDDDDNGAANLESLNSQTLYIDSSSLANGDLSNVVLMTGPPPSASTTEQVHNRVVAFGDAGHLATASADLDQQQLMEH